MSSSVIFNKPLPQNIDTERAVLGCILIEGGLIKKVSAILDDEDFYETKHKKIYSAMLRMLDQGIAIDLTSLFEYLNSNGKADEVGGSIYLIYLTENIPTTVNIQYYAELVKEQNKKRILIESAHNIIKEANNDHSSSFEISSKYEKIFFTLTEDSQNEQAVVSNLSQTLLSAEELNLIKSASDNSYIADRIKYGKLRTDAPPEYHEFCAYFELSSIAGRNLKCSFAHGDIYPNLYILNLGSSGYRKTTAMNYSAELLLKVDPEIFLPNDYSPEALIESLSEKPHGVFFRDEFSGFLSQLTKRDYQTGLKELINKLYDCPEMYKRKLREREFVIDKPYLSILSGAVPDKFIRSLVDDDFYSGFFARFLPIMPESKIDYKDVSAVNDSLINIQNILVKKLKNISDATSSPCSVSLDKDALETYNSYCHKLEHMQESEYYADEIGATYTRLRDYVIKFGMLRQLSEQIPENGNLKISCLNLLRAMEVVERVRKWSRDLIFRFKSGNTQREKDRFLRVIDNHPGITTRDLCRWASKKKDFVEPIINQLKDEGKAYTKPIGKTYGWFIKPNTDSLTPDSSDTDQTVKASESVRVSGVSNN